MINESKFDLSNAQTLTEIIGLNVDFWRAYKNKQVLKFTKIPNLLTL